MSNPKFDLFISYSSTDEVHRFKGKDFEVIKFVKKHLEKYRHPVTGSRVKVCTFNEDFELSETVKQAIINALQNSAYVLVICSQNSKKSPWVQFEVDWSFKNNSTTLIPAVLNMSPGACFPDVFEDDTLGIDLNLAEGDQLKDWKTKVEIESHKLLAKVWDISKEKVYDRYEAAKRKLNRQIGFSVSSVLFVLLGLGLYGIVNWQQAQIAERENLGKGASLLSQSFCFKENSLVYAIKGVSQKNMFGPPPPGATNGLHDVLNKITNQYKIKIDNGTLMSAAYCGAQSVLIHTTEDLFLLNTDQRHPSLRKISTHIDHVVGSETHKKFATYARDSLYVFDEYGKMTNSLSLKLVDIKSIDFSENGNTIFGLGKHTLFRWDYSSNILDTIPINIDWSNENLYWTHQCKDIFALPVSEKSLNLIQFGAVTEEMRYSMDDIIHRVDIDDKNNFIGILSRKGELKVFRFWDSKPILNLKTNANHGGIKFLPEDQVIAISGWNDNTNFQEGDVRMISIADGSISAVLHNNAGTVRDFQFSEDEEYALVAYDLSTVSLWDIDQAIPQQTLECSEEEPLFGLINNQGTQSLIGWLAGNLTIWNHYGDRYKQQNQITQETFNDLFMDPTIGKTSSLFSQLGEHKIRIASDTSNHELNLSVHEQSTLRVTDSLNHVLFEYPSKEIITATSPTQESGEVIIAHENYLMKVVLTSGDIIWTAPFEGDEVDFFMQSRHGKYLLALGAYGKISVFDIQSGREIWTKKEPNHYGPKGTFINNHELAIGGYNGEIQFYNLKNNQNVPLPISDYLVTHLFYSEKDNILIALDGLNKVYIIDVDRKAVASTFSLSREGFVDKVKYLEGGIIIGLQKDKDYDEAPFRINISDSLALDCACEYAKLYPNIWAEVKNVCLLSN
ncbi:MAG: TIR domain-containing protein [Cyclobacteriaceae bacterium]